MHHLQPLGQAAGVRARRLARPRGSKELLLHGALVGVRDRDHSGVLSEGERIKIPQAAHRGVTAVAQVAQTTHRGVALEERVVEFARQQQGGRRVEAPLREGMLVCGGCGGGGGREGGGAWRRWR